MPKIVITFPDGNKKEYEKGVTGRDVAKSIGERLARDALCVKVNDKIISLDLPINENSTFKILTFNDKEGVYAFRHSTAHVFAHAIRRLYPNAKNTIGPPVEEGFYYDFDDLDITPEDFPKIEAEMQKVVDADLPFERRKITLEELKKLFPNNQYKIELAEEFSKSGEELTTYKDGDFEDLCEGPHVTSTGMIKAFKLNKLAGAYWRGDSKNKQLTRIYGISFPEKKQLKEYLDMIAEAERRDHRKIGRELDLWSFNEVSPACPFFHPKGMIIYNELVKLMRDEYFKRGYQEISTPTIFHKQLWMTSGHWDHYQDNMFLLQGGETGVKPMNCPAGVLIYKSRVRSYKELPLRLADFGVLHRKELAGVLSGLFRVMRFIQDDAHIFVDENRMLDEISGVLEFVKHIYSLFGFEYKVELSTRPEKAMGSEELWNKAEENLMKALDQNGIKYNLNPGDGAFYGPKIDFHIKDCLGRTWQCGTVQLDFQMPQRFGLKFMGMDGENKYTPVMIHRALFGSLERFIGILTEHFAGKFPLWLSPVQVRMLTINDSCNSYAQKLLEDLKKNFIRVEIDEDSETMNKKVRKAQLDKVPLILTIGEKEQLNNTVAVRTLDGKVLFGINRESFIEQVVKLVKDRSLEVKLS